MDELDEYIEQTETIAFLIQDLSEEEELKIVHGYEYCMIKDALNLIENALISFRNTRITLGMGAEGE